MLDKLDKWREQLTPGLLRALGGDRFLPSIQLVPDDLLRRGRRRLGSAARRLAVWPTQLQLVFETDDVPNGAA
jgi:hypothetical protein